MELDCGQAEVVRFCIDNSTRIIYFREMGLFNWKNGSITINYKPTGEIQNVIRVEVKR